MKKVCIYTNNIILELLLSSMTLVFSGIVCWSFIDEMPMEELIIYARQLIMPSIEYLTPERSERLIFQLLCLLSPFICILACLTVRRVANKVINNNILSALFVLLWLFWYYCWTGTDFLSLMFAPSIKTFYGLLILPFFTVAIIWWMSVKHKSFFLADFIICSLILVFLIAIITCSRIYSLNTIDKYTMEHQDIIAYAISQSAAGWADRHQYGMYPQIIAPLFRIITPSLFNISIIMAILYCLSMIILGISIFKLMQNRLLMAGLAATLILVGSWGYLNRDFNDPYFAYYPIRFLFPVLGICCFIGILYDRKRSQFWLITAAAISGIGLLWNIDSGVPLIASYCLCLVGDWLYERDKKTFKNLMIYTLITPSIAVLFYYVLGFFSSSCVDIAGQLSYQRIFYIAGYMMLPLPGFPAPWFAVLLVYLLGMLAGIHAYTYRRVSIINRVLLFLSVLGIGLFSYYQGRSHDYNLPAVIWPAIIIIFIVGDYYRRCYLAKIIPQFIFISLLLPAVILTVLSFMTFSINSGKIFSGLKNITDNVFPGHQSEMTQKVNFIKMYSGINRTVNIYGPWQGVFYAETGLKSGISNFGKVDTLLIAERERCYEEMAKSNLPLFLMVSNREPGLPLWVINHYNVIAATPDQQLFFMLPKLSSSE